MVFENLINNILKLVRDELTIHSKSMYKEDNNLVCRLRKNEEILIPIDHLISVKVIKDGMEIKYYQLLTRQASEFASKTRPQLSK